MPFSKLSFHSLGDLYSLPNDYFPCSHCHSPSTCISGERYNWFQKILSLEHMQLLFLNLKLYFFTQNSIFQSLKGCISLILFLIFIIFGLFSCLFCLLVVWLDCWFIDFGKTQSSCTAHVDLELTMWFGKALNCSAFCLRLPWVEL